MYGYACILPNESKPVKSKLLGVKTVNFPETLGKNSVAGIFNLVYEN